MFSEGFLVLLPADETCFFFVFFPALSPLNVALPYLNAGMASVLAESCGIRVTEVVTGWITYISCFRLTDRALKATIIIADTARYLFNAVLVFCFCTCLKFRISAVD